MAIDRTDLLVLTVKDLDYRDIIPSAAVAIFVSQAPSRVKISNLHQVVVSKKDTGNRQMNPCFFRFYLAHYP